MRNAFLKAAIVCTVSGLLFLWVFAQGSGRAGATAFAGPFLYAWQRIDRAVSTAFRTVVPWEHGPGARARDTEARLRLCEIRLAETDLLRHQNAELRQLQNLPPFPGWHVVVAEVISRDPVTWNRGFRIGCGRAQGVTTGDAVLAGPFVIGRVTECSEQTAAVTTVAAQACRLGVVLGKAKYTGVLSGRGAQKWRQQPDCIVDFLPKETTAEPGDTVYTSGLGGNVPAGLVVGRLALTQDAPVRIIDSAHARATVVPNASFGRLSFVAVVCRAEPACPEIGHSIQ